MTEKDMFSWINKNCKFASKTIKADDVGLIGKTKSAPRRINIGDKVKVSMGIDSGQIATVVPMNRIKTDGRGIPQIDQGHYHPIDKDDVAIMFDNGTLDVHKKWHLIPV